MRDDLDELRHIEGFPMGEDEDIHAISNPPYYTAYPNPHIAQFIEEQGYTYDEETDDYLCEPFTEDISASKNDKFYTVHSYHTKVPDKIIQAYISHYTGRNDIVVDVFSGSGMTGIAAQALGRASILIDLCPVASHIANNYRLLANCIPNQITETFNQIMNEIERQYNWMYKTETGKNVNWCVWSEVLECPYCRNENLFYFTSTSNNSIQCENCKANLAKKGLNRIIKERNGGYIPVLINYGTGKNRSQRVLSEFDLNLLEKIENTKIPYWYPDLQTNFHEKKWGRLSQGNHRGFNRYSQFYPRRSLFILSAFREYSMKEDNPEIRSFLMFVLTATAYGLTIFNRYLPERNSNVGMLANTLFIPPLYSETNAINKLRKKYNRFIAAQRGHPVADSIISTQSATDLQNIPDNTLDYAFVDPPFGDNILYVSSNSVPESWLRVFSNGIPEAIISEWRNKSPEVYRNLLSEAFKELFRILKPGRWITVEFHNSRALIWNYLHESIIRAGLVIAQVTILDKKGTTIFMDTRAGAVNKDLVISAYKPKKNFTKKLIALSGYGLEKEFISQHLIMLPISSNPERTSQMLYSKVLAYYIQHGYLISYNSEQFYRTLPRWGFMERDGYWFADEAQVNEYERRKAEILTEQIKGRRKISLAQSVLFISDERSARQWLWNILVEEKSFSDIHTEFLKALQTPEDQIPELQTLLEEGFIRTDGNWKRPDMLTQAELEKRRHDRLLRQFDEYIQIARAGQRLKEVRQEAVVAGFTEAYRENRFQDILTVGNKLPKRLLEESRDLFDFVDIAEAKMET